VKALNSVVDEQGRKIKPLTGNCSLNTSAIPVRIVFLD